ncbi:hypothetical protein MTO96_025563 [Rhipicephalus appendiculatus]
MRIRYWKKQREKLMATNSTRRAFRGPKTGKFPDVEKAVLEYVRDMRKDGCAVSLDMVRTQARTVSRRLGIATKDFRASSGWTTRFMRRNGLSLRRRTSLCQRLPSAYADKVIDFHTGRVKYEVEGEKRRGHFKARKNLVLDVFPFKDLVARVRTHDAQENKALIKSEFGKVRLAVSAPLEVYLRLGYLYGVSGSAYLSWPGNTLEESVAEEMRWTERTFVRIG